jgi:hypothetical protein
MFETVTDAENLLTARRLINLSPPQIHNYCMLNIMCRNGPAPNCDRSNKTRRTAFHTAAHTLSNGYPCKSCLTKHYKTKTYGGVGEHTHIFQTLALIADEWSASHPNSFTPGEKAPFYRKLGGPQSCLDDMVKRKFLTLLGLKLQPLNRSALMQSLYRLRYRGLSMIIVLS